MSTFDVRWDRYMHANDYDGDNDLKAESIHIIVYF